MSEFETHAESLCKMAKKLGATNVVSFNAWPNTSMQF